MTYTTGPLTISGPNHGQNFIIVADDGGIIAETFHFTGNHKRVDSKANAQLFATAHKLLDACEMALPVLQEFAEAYEPPTDWQNVRVTPEQAEQIEDWKRLQASTDNIADAIAEAKGSDDRLP